MKKKPESQQKPETPRLATKKQFAELHGWSPGYVTKLAKQQRLVMEGNLVDVEESNTLIEQTAGGRLDVGMRHEQHRTEKAEEAKPTEIKPTRARKAAVDDEVAGTPAENKPAETQQDDANQDKDQIIDKEAVQAAHRRKVMADMRRAESLAEKENLELQKMAGRLIEVEQADLALRMVGTTIRSLMDVLPGQVAPLVAPASSIEECNSILAEQCRNVLLEFTETLQREKQKLERPAA